jgi:hypothetical protein
MGFIASFVIAIAFAVVGELLRPKQTPPNAKAAALDDFDIPTAEEGRKIPLIAGKVKITGPNVTWWGDLEITAIKRKVKTGWFSSATQVINNKYLIGMQMVLCHGRAEGVTLHKVFFGDDEPSNTKTAEPNGVTRIDFDDNDFFGGDESEGGVAGTVRFYSGTTTQTANAYWEDQIGETAPAYRRLCYAVLEHVYVGTSHYLKPVGFEVSSYPNGLSVPSGRHQIGDDCNPICLIYEILTDRVWGACVLPSDLDTASFLAAAETVYSEGFGMSMIYNGASTARDIIAEILRHIDGVMFSDPETGLITVKLARDDYDIDTIPVFTKDDFVGGIKFSRPSWSETKNRITAGWTNRENDYNVSPVSQVNLANVQARGGVIDAEDMDFTGFCTEAACNLAVSRALRVKSYPLANLEGKLKRRSGWRLKQASVFKVVWPELGINGVVFRVSRVAYGTLNEPSVSVNCVEDIFAVGESAFVEMPPSGWVDPVGAPVALARQKLFELPVQFTGNTTGAHIATLASRASGIDIGYKVYSGLASGDLNLGYRGDVIDFTPSAVTTSAFPDTTPNRDATGFTVTDVRHRSEIPATVTEEELQAGDSIILIVSAAGEELCAAKNFTGTAVTDVIRGVYGTSKLNHPVGAVVWFLSQGFGIENQTPHVGFPKTVYGKLLPYNAKGALPIASATQLTVTLVGKSVSPGTPSNVLIAGSATPPDGSAGSGDVAVAWNWRDPMIEGGRLNMTGNSPLPQGMTFTLRRYRDGVLAETTAGITTLAATYTVAQQNDDASNTSGGNMLIQFRVSAVLNSIESAYAANSIVMDKQVTKSYVRPTGADGSTTITDLVPPGGAWTVYGTSAISTDHAFGGDPVLEVNSSNTGFGRGDIDITSAWTVEFFMRLRTLPPTSTTRFVLDLRTADIQMVPTIDVTNTGVLQVYMNGAYRFSTAAGTIAALTDYRIHLERDATGVVRLFVDGDFKGKFTLAGAMATPRPVMLGRRYNGDANRSIDGFLGHFRWSAIARRGSDDDFTPPSVPYTLD